MNNKLVINFVPGPTPVHKLAGSTKMLIFLLFTVAIIATFDIRVIAALMIVPIIAIISMRPNYKPLIVLLSVMLVTTGVIGSIMLLIVSPDTGFSHVGGSTIIWQASEKLFVTRETLWYLLVTMTKRVASFLTVMMFALATTPSEFASGLAFLHMPYKVCTIVSLAYRTIPDIASKFIDIRNSMQMRGVELSKKASVGKRLKATGQLLIPLVMSSFGRVESIANAMDLRGYGRLKTRTWYAEHELTKLDKILRIAAIFFGAAILFYIVYFRIINPYPAEMWCPFIAEEDIIAKSQFEDIFFLKWFNK